MGGVAREVVAYGTVGRSAPPGHSCCSDVAPHFLWKRNGDGRGRGEEVAGC